MSMIRADNRLQRWWAQQRTYCAILAVCAVAVLVALWWFRWQFDAPTHITIRPLMSMASHAVFGAFFAFLLTKVIRRTAEAEGIKVETRDYRRINLMLYKVLIPVLALLGFWRGLFRQIERFEETM